VDSPAGNFSRYWSMNKIRFSLAVATGCALVCCSDRSDQSDKTKSEHNQESEVDRGARSASAEPEENEDGGPREEEIAEDCVAFLRSTKSVPPNLAKPDCPECVPSAEAKEVLKFERLQVDGRKCSATACDVTVTIAATFNPATGGGTMAGGLTGWIPAGQKTQYQKGETPAGLQSYRAKVIYRRHPKGWRAVEFERA
jgi:hypothetical protein